MLLCASLFSIAQNDNNKILEEIKFSNHWHNINEFEDAIFVLSQIDTTIIANKIILDSINYLFGWNHYCLKQLEASTQYLMLVKPTASTFIKSRFFSAYNQSHLTNYEQSRNVILDLKLESPNMQKLKNFELSGISLLERNMEEFDSLSKKFTQSYYPISNQERNFFEYYEKLNNYKPKSMLAAGIFSAVVPGLGKIYAKRYGEGISTFFITASMGLVTWENYRKDGIMDVKTIIFGSLFSVFYLGNIWGSVFSIRMQRNDFNNAINNQILLDMHIPLRTIFN